MYISNSFRLFCLILFSCIAFNLHAKEIHISGSDWLDNVFNTVLDDVAKSRGDTITWQLKGSYPALKSIYENETDLALIALPNGPQTLDSSLKAIPLTYLATIIAVHQENPIESINKKALQGIYNLNPTNPIDQWGQLKLKNAWESFYISAHIANKEAHPLSTLFKHTCLETSSLKPSIQQWDNVSKLRLHLSNNTLGIAALPYFERLSEEKLKPLPIVLSENNIPVSPNRENIHNGQYPYRIAFYMVFQREKQEKVLPYCKALLNENIHQQLLDHALTPLPEKVRKKEILRLDFER